MNKGELIFFCGKMGAGKSTLAKQKAEEKDAVLISEDDLLAKLYAGKVKSVRDYKHYSDILKPVVCDMSQQILSKGVSVVLDFPANTENQRQWLRSLSDKLTAEHICYFVERPDEICIKQLLQRGNPNTDTVEIFHAMTKYFTEPSDDEHINVVRV